MGQWDALDANILVVVRRQSARNQVARDVHVNHLVAESGRRVYPADGAQVAGGEPRLFAQLALGGVVRRFADLDHAGGNLQQRLLDGMPVLANHQNVVVGVNGNDGDRARMVDNLPRIAASIRRHQRIFPNVEHDAVEDGLGVNALRVVGHVRSLRWALGRLAGAGGLGARSNLLPIEGSPPRVFSGMGDSRTEAPRLRGDQNPRG